MEDLIGRLENVLNGLVDVLDDIITRRFLDTIDLDNMGDSLFEVLGNDILDSLFDLVVELDDGSSGRIIASRVDSLVNGLADALVDVVFSLLDVLLDLGSVNLHSAFGVIGIG